jgi:hypothetical protein
MQLILSHKKFMLALAIGIGSGFAMQLYAVFLRAVA